MKEQHSVKWLLIAPLQSGRYEITFAEWDTCQEVGGCQHRPDDEGWGRASRPVMNVSWDDAKSYVAWLSKEMGAVYRLPSEAGMGVCSPREDDNALLVGRREKGRHGQLSGLRRVDWEDDRSRVISTKQLRFV